MSPLPSVRKLELEAHMDQLRAEEELAAGCDDDDRLYGLVLSATGSEARASEALAARLMARMKANQKPEG